MTTLKPLLRNNISNDTVRPVKVLQFGEGNFLRAFVDWIIDILNEETSFNGDVRIVQPLPVGMGDLLNKQGGLYHVVMNGIRNGSIVRQNRLIKCVRGVINPYEDYEAYLKEAENQALRFIVSNTTEAGIVFSPADKTPEQVPGSFPAKVTSLLFRRYTTFHGTPESGLIFLPCELIEKNGEMLKAAVLQYIKHWNLPDDFAAWVDHHNVFCNTLVDRIVPGFPADTISEIQQEIGFDDKLVVKAEPFHLWVIEGPKQVAIEFPTAKTELDVQFVNDLSPYRTRKVRILNGAHTAMVPVAYMKGLRTVQEMVEDSFTGEFLKQTVFKEIIPTLDLSEDELKSFAEDVLERFRNPFIRHELISIALNSISKFKVRVLPSLLQYVERKKSLPANLVTSLASLICFYRGECNGMTIPLKDSADVLEFFSSAWKENDIQSTVRVVLANTDFWDTDLTLVPGLQEAVISEVRAIDTIKHAVQSK